MKRKSRKKKARARRKAGKALHKVSPRARATLFRDIHRVLERHGIRGRVTELHVEAAPTAAAAPPAAEPPAAEPPAAEPAAPKLVKRVVCRRLPSGTMRCEEQFVPI